MPDDAEMDMTWHDGDLDLVAVGCGDAVEIFFKTQACSSTPEQMGTIIGEKQAELTRRRGAPGRARGITHVDIFADDGGWDK